VQLPEPRGQVSAQVLAALAQSRPSYVTGIEEWVGRRPSPSPLHDEDRQLTLWILNELHYQGFDGVADDLEWAPELLSVRRALEAETEQWLRQRTESPVRRFMCSAEDVAERIFSMVAQDDGPSPARYLRNRASRSQAIEWMIHRSVYTLKEADPHTWAIPRLRGSAKVALVELQYDEYGAGVPERQHARMFADALRACGLDDEYGAYVDIVPAPTLAISNVVSMFGLHRRLRGAAMGHLAAFEATSSLPARDVSAGLTRLGLGNAAPYFDEHVEADAVHEQVAAREICGVLAKTPAMTAEIAFGAAACLLVDAVAGAHLLQHWRSGVSSLRVCRPSRDVGDELVPAG
jgi:hypothetical protein